MRLVIDTNILISALLLNNSLPAHLIELWREGLFVFLSSLDQIDELRRVTRYPKIRDRLTPSLAGRLINEVRDLAIMVADLPEVAICNDPTDNYLLGIAKAGRADFVVSGDKRDILVLKEFDGVPIVTVREFLNRAGRLP